MNILSYGRRIQETFGHDIKYNMIFQNSSHPVIGCIDDYYCLAPRHNKSREKHKRPIKSSQREFQIGYIAMPSI